MFVNAKRLKAFVAAAACGISLLTSATPALAAPGTIKTIDNPVGTTMNLFNYSLTSISAGSINSGNHTLLFNGATNGSKFNEYTYANPQQGIVKNTLGGDGYPVINDKNGESLAYLFDPTRLSSNGDVVANSGVNAVHTNVNGLLHIDNEGYYVYDSNENYAYFDRGSAGQVTDGLRFTVYDTPGVPIDKGVNQGVQGLKQDGQFYPFNDPDKWENNAFNSVYNYGINVPGADFLFGMTMTTEFSQPSNGQVLNKDGEYVPMTYSFRGDDDVWVFIDDVLVADLGGIHDPVGVDINFATGDVTIKNWKGETLPKYGTTLKKAFEAAGKSELINEDGTFKDGSQHTLKFFYMERGAGASNMQIRYNLVSNTDIAAHKSLIRSNDNQESLKEDQFKYRLTGLTQKGSYGQDVKALMPNGAKDDDNGNLVIEAAVDGTGTVNFGNLEMSENTVGKTYKYMMEELGPDKANPVGPENNKQGEINYDSTKYYFTGTVKKDEDGKYYLEKTYYTDNTFNTPATSVSFPTFTNYYDGAGVVTLDVTKTLNGGEPGSDYAGKFGFTLTASNSANPMPTTATATADANGKVTFAPIRFTTANLTEKNFDGSYATQTKTFDYTIQETIPGGAEDNIKDGIIYTDKTVNVKVYLHYDADSKTMSAWAEYGDRNTDADKTFENKTLNPATGDIRLKKTMNGRNMGEKEFSFTLAVNENDQTTVDAVTNGALYKYENGKVVKLPVTADVPQGEDGKAVDFVFTGITYKTAGTYKFKVTENALESVTGVVSDSRTAYVTVTVAAKTDDPTSLEVKSTVISSDEAGGETFGTFNNYSVGLVVNKVKDDGKTALPGAKFTLKKKDVNGVYKVVNGAQNIAADENGHAYFKGLDLTPGDYEIEETWVPAGYTKAPNIKFTINGDLTSTWIDPTTGESKAGDIVTPDKNGYLFSTTIVNNKGITDLPQTGGTGNMPLFVSGVALIAGAVAVVSRMKSIRL